MEAQIFEEALTLSCFKSMRERESLNIHKPDSKLVHYSCNETFTTTLEEEHAIVTFCLCLLDFFITLHINNCLSDFLNNA